MSIRRYAQQSLAKPNQCPHTGIESKFYHRFGPTLKVYESIDKIRLIAFCDKKPVSALILQKIGKLDFVIDMVYTLPDFRRMGKAKTLLAISRVLFGSVKHSEHLTRDGEKWLNSVENLGAK
tara:strand:+ start:903 stop:1268 length:366 start_codon:yes stop_codon:yes gene_type:complete